jgi:hypothetical protein
MWSETAMGGYLNDWRGGTLVCMLVVVIDIAAMAMLTVVIMNAGDDAGGADDILLLMVHPNGGSGCDAIFLRQKFLERPGQHGG